MPVTLLVYRTQPRGQGQADLLEEEDAAGLIGAITFDAPRLRIGRGESCDLRLPDASVSAVHASLRLRGNDYVLVDEGSTNGTRIGRETLTAQAPRRVGPNEVLRFGKVWVELRIGSAPVTRSAPSVAKELALDYVIAALDAEGEDARPCVSVEEGPDAGRDVRVIGALPVIVGRSKDTQLSLNDADVSRRHVEIKRRGDVLVVRDAGSKAGSTLGDEPLGTGDTVWRCGVPLTLGSTRLSYTFEAVSALSEIERASDVKVPPAELVFAPLEAPVEEEDADALDAEAQAEPEPAAAQAEEESDEDQEDARLSPRERDRRAARWSITDFAVVILALGVCSLSAVGYFVLLR